MLHLPVLALTRDGAAAIIRRSRTFPWALSSGIPARPLVSFPLADARVSDPFVAQLADLCRAHVTRAKWVFVPTHAHRPHARRAHRARRHQLAEPALRDAARHRAPHGRAVPRRARHRSVGRRSRPGADHAAAARPAARGRLLPPARRSADAWRRRCGRRCASCAWPASSRTTCSADAFASPAKHAELRALLAAYEAVPRREQPRRHGARLRGGAAASRLVPDPAGGLLDRAAGRRLDAAAAPADRRDAWRAHRAARARAPRRQRCRAA